MTPYQLEVLDGHREAVAAYGTTVILEGVLTPLPVVMANPEASLDALLTATQAQAAVNFEVECTLAAAAGLKQESIFAVAGDAQRFHVTSAQPDPGSPLLYVSGELLV